MNEKEDVKIAGLAAKVWRQHERLLFRLWKRADQKAAKAERILERRKGRVRVTR